jgi:outer membrane protein TolC
MRKKKSHLYIGLAVVAGGIFLPACSTSHYRRSADKEVYRIIGEKQNKALGQTNEFSIDTQYSKRNPDDIKQAEILEDRLRAEKLKPNLSQALELAVENSRAFQLQKENLYLSALTLTRDRHDFHPHFFANAVGSLFRDSNGDKGGSVQTDAGASQLLKSGATLGLNIANDLLRYFTGDPRRTAITTLSANFAQPLLRGAGASIVAENLTQSERNVIYEVRNFSRFQNTFALGIVSTYYRLLQLRDTVRNEYNNYQSLIRVRERVEALLGRGDFSQIQVDQANQDELSAKNRYIFAVQNYQTQLDQFKNTLGLPLGTDLALDDSALQELDQLGLLPVTADDRQAYDVAVQRRLDLLNEIDRFEDAQRKIRVAANQLKADLNIVADASLQSRGPTDYAHFDFDEVQASAGLQLNLPLDRLRERNSYRASLINFERQIRSLAQALDSLREDVLSGLRDLKRAQQSYIIQRNAVELANRRVESATILLQAGRVQIRDLLEAQNAQVQARNALTQNLVDYHLVRLRLLIDVGVVDTGEDRFWLKPYAIGVPPETPTPANPVPAPVEEVIPPDTLFGKR